MLGRQKEKRVDHVDFMFWMCTFYFELDTNRSCRRWARWIGLPTRSSTITSRISTSNKMRPTNYKRNSTTTFVAWKVYYLLSSAAIDYLFDIRCCLASESDRFFIRIRTSWDRAIFFLHFSSSSFFSTHTHVETHRRLYIKFSSAQTDSVCPFLLLSDFISRWMNASKIRKSLTWPNGDVPYLVHSKW